MPYKKDWKEFYDITRSKPPRDLLIKALTFITTKGKAIDIGGGALRDTKHLLKEGFEVTVVDSSQLVMEEARAIPNTKLTVHISSFEDFVFPVDEYVLASAMYSLPFCSPGNFDRVVDNIKKSLKPGGVFCGQLFGDRDEWTNNRKMTFHTIGKAKQLFDDMDIILFEEEEKDDKAGQGEIKHWHIFHFITRKK